MYQSFDTPSHDQGAARLASLRAELSKRGLSGFIVPRADAHRGETVPPRDERLRWLTGFTGSAGLCIALTDNAAVFIDGRYTLQAAEQVDGSAFENVGIPETKPAAWLAQHSGQGAVIGFDPWLLTPEEVERYGLALGEVGATLRAEPDNPIDAVWSDQPAPPNGAVRSHAPEYAGVASTKKRSDIAGLLKASGVDHFILTLPDSIAWLLNIRGSDIAHTPVVLAFAIMHADETVDLFVEGERVDDAARAHLGPNVRTHAPHSFVAALAALDGKTGFDPSNAPSAVSDILRAASGSTHEMADPCILPKARKNATELKGARAAHLRDGAALAQFLCWLDHEAPSGALNEIEAAKKLQTIREETGLLLDISFDTISAFGPHAALPHYRVSRESNLEIKGDTLYLVDSGGQYQDGTTDVTRTVAVGTPAPDMIRTFTLVLKGMIAVSLQRFPAGTTGVQIDTLARAALWREGYEFDHGTGHGVGSYLDVHEGPASLSKRGTVALEPGMILSNEPGYYREGAFGIRIENLIIVSEPSIPDGGERKMMEFETLTLAPIDLRLIDPSLMDGGEIEWLNAYHRRVYDALHPLVDETTKGWLEAACSPLTQTH